MTDPDFGELRYDRSLQAWQGFSELQLTDERTALAIHSDGSPPTPAQRETYLELCRRFEKLRPAIAKATFRYYRWNRIFIFPIVRVFARLFYGADDLDAYYKHATNLDEVWGLLTLPSVEIPLDQPGPPVVAFLFECDWDEEHGFMVVFTDWRVSYAGLQT